MYQTHTIETAPEESRPALQGLRQNFGLIPNLAATMAESPVLINGFVGAFSNFHGGSFTGGEKQVLLLTNAVTNRCAWAVAFHSTMALKEGVSREAVEGIRQGKLPADPRLATLAKTTRLLIETRGHLGSEAVAEFEAAGYSPAQLFEIIAGLAVSTMANYAGNVANPPLEAPFRGEAWQG